MTGNKILRRFKNAHFKPSCCWRFIGIPVGDNWNSVEFLMDFLLTKNILCQKGNWYVLGYDHVSEETRVYALSRIKNIQFTNDSFELPKDFDVSKHVDLSFGIWNNTEPPEEYELLFSSDTANYILEKEWHKDQEMEQKEDGSVLLKFKSNQKQQIFSWVLGFGTAVTVIKPVELKEDLKAEINRLAEKYK